mmetsp:Transcript_111554/g.193339  ORF Transcript_111554/g.193339 Transcript_111554/m.193339 type:complete len:83 (+) Transcript_111554:190-438(+)
MVFIWRRLSDDSQVALRPFSIDTATTADSLRNASILTGKELSHQKSRSSRTVARTGDAAFVLAAKGRGASATETMSAGAYDV